MDRALESLVGPELAAWAATADVPDAARDRGRTRRFEDPRLGGTLLVTMTPLISTAGDPAGHVIVARDITHEIRLEQEQAALRERLAQSEKLAALGQFVAGIAHEMNNPCGRARPSRAADGNSDRAPPAPPDLRDLPRSGSRGEDRRNLLVFAGSRRMVRRRMRVSRCCRGRSAAGRVAGAGGHRGHTRRGADLPAVLGDPLLMHQAFLNILINAEHAILGTGQAGRSK